MQSKLSSLPLRPHVTFSMQSEVFVLLCFAPSHRYVLWSLDGLEEASGRRKACLSPTALPLCFRVANHATSMGDKKLLSKVWLYHLTLIFIKLSCSSFFRAMHKCSLAASWYYYMVHKDHSLAMLPKFKNNELKIQVFPVCNIQLHCGSSFLLWNAYPFPIKMNGWVCLCVYSFLDFGL